MNKKVLRTLCYIAWIAGIISAGFLVYGIIRALFLTLIFIQAVLILYREGFGVKRENEL